MAQDPTQAIALLDRRFLLDHPADAAIELERHPAEALAPTLNAQSVQVLVPVWRRLLPEAGARLLAVLPEPTADALLAELLPADAVQLLAHLDPDERRRRLDRLDPAVRRDLEMLMAFPEGSAGRLMDSRVVAYRGSMTVAETLQALRERGAGSGRSLYLVDLDRRLVGRIFLQDLAVASPQQTLAALAQPIVASVEPTTPQEEVTGILNRGRFVDLPVVNFDGILLGVVSQESLIHAMQEEAAGDIQTMVGASRDERALSSSRFAVRKRMPWLQINLATAFLAASVVGLFESTIAQFTALAVLLPVVAGQSGNAGAQALAVTMRGLALHEITARDWLRVMRKEVTVGFLNGVAVALTCGVAVYLWSGSLGLVLVITSSMILAMMVAGFAGAVVPVMLVRLGQDPAQSSSIVLTTITDVAGFFAFLGIASALSALL
ncbi:magnesium transporter [Reyranella sp.]|uniref:magnesium transporter n=1 Tax=Reyranella sp. TaxID=1929291 RepID=UPI003BACE8B7